LERTAAWLSEKLMAIGVQENERNLNNEIERGGFTVAFLLQFLKTMECPGIRL
jgi:Domain of unknown function (DUF6471)